VIAGTQLGHAISFFVRFGSSAASQQSAGLHTYYPAFSGTLSGLIGGVLMACMAILAVARILHGTSPGRRPRRSASVGAVLPALFTAQLLLFVGQETLECLIGGRAVPSPMEELLWGVFGQLPAALVASVVVSWLSARMESAWAVLVASTARLLPDHLVQLAETRPRPAAPVPSGLATAFPRAFRKRGPPTPLPSSAL
jgi:hypothetical protein